jgi:hypothetical protein
MILRPLLGATLPYELLEPAARLVSLDEEAFFKTQRQESNDIFWRRGLRILGLYFLNAKHQHWRRWYLQFRRRQLPELLAF